MIRYYGIPRSNLVKFGDDADSKPAQPLPKRDDLAQHPPFAWGHRMVGTKTVVAQVDGAAGLALALCAHALADDQRAVALYQRFKMRAMDKWAPDIPWSVTVEEICAVCDKIEADTKEIAKAQAEADRDRPKVESEVGGGLDPSKGGIQWTTDDRGNKLPGSE